ncbi:hypothetical protein [Sneathiella sp.]|uniref:hypothetical protein n=1 Tax=Sneathiella sp. TaxID=1964365 RepID=UPI002FE214DA
MRKTHHINVFEAIRPVRVAAMPGLAFSSRIENARSSKAKNLSTTARTPFMSLSDMYLGG